MYNYDALVTRVIDGDTFEANVDMGFYISACIRFRVKGYDAPESYRPKTDAEKAHGLEASLYAKSLLEGKVVRLTTFKEGVYNRWDAVVTLASGADFVQLMVDAGFTKKESYV